MKPIRKNKTIVIALFFWFVFCATVYSQAIDSPEESHYKKPSTGLWMNTYGNIRLTDRLFWIAQTHFRFEEQGNTEFVGQIGQIYNRHAISYLVSKKFNASLGGVLRLNFNTSSETEMQRSMVPEWRIWHQYLFAMPMNQLMVYHRIRIEHRWSQGFNEDSEYIFRNRWRYMFKLKIPIFKPKLESNTF